MPLAFFVNGETEVVTSLASCVKDLKIETEQILPVMYQPLAVFRVRAVARCTSSLQGHTEAVISTAFSPTGKWVNGHLQVSIFHCLFGNCFILVEVNNVINAPVYLRYLASGSGDTTVRFWDLTTETPLYTARGINYHQWFDLKLSSMRLLSCIFFNFRTHTLGTQHRMVTRWQETGIRMQEQSGEHPTHSCLDWNLS